MREINVGYIYILYTVGLQQTVCTPVARLCVSHSPRPGNTVSVSQRVPRCRNYWGRRVGRCKEESSKLLQCNVNVNVAHGLMTP